MSKTRKLPTTNKYNKDDCDACWEIKNKRCIKSQSTVSLPCLPQHSGNLVSSPDSNIYSLIQQTFNEGPNYLFCASTAAKPRR